MEGFKPRAEIFMHCCGHCEYAVQDKHAIQNGLCYFCHYTGKFHHYRHICDCDPDDHSEQISIFDQSYKCDGTQVISTNRWPEEK